MNRFELVSMEYGLFKDNDKDLQFDMYHCVDLLNKQDGTIEVLRDELKFADKIHWDFKKALDEAEEIINKNCSVYQQKKWQKIRESILG